MQQSYAQFLKSESVSCSLSQVPVIVNGRISRCHNTYMKYCGVMNHLLICFLDYIAALF